TALLVAAAFVLTILGQAVTGKVDLKGLFATAADQATGTYTIFPFTFVFAALVFVVMLQLTFVSGREPLRRLPPVAAGLVALVVAWGVGLIVYVLVVNWSFVPPPAREALGLHDPGGPVNALDLVGWLLCVVIWQVTFFILLGGWPFTAIRHVAVRVVVSNVVVVGGGWLTYLLLHDAFDWDIPKISAIGGCVAAAVLLQAMLFETWPYRGPSAVANRVGLVVSSAVVVIVLYWGLRGIGNATEEWTEYPVELWVAGVGLNLMAALVIIHYAMWGRWPFRPPAPPAPTEDVTPERS
ncbi:MAG: hypothetical protein ACRDTD_32065, partial [Pseudonocardiaceae bacterium]